MHSFIRLKTVLLTLAALIFCSLLTIGCGSLFPAEEEQLKPPLIQPETIVYKTIKAARGNLLQELRMSGVFVPETAVSMSFEKQGGRLKTLAVSSGGTVKAGDLIAELDSASLASTIRIQEIEVEKSQLSLSQLRANSADAYSIKRAGLDLKQQEIRLDDLKKQMAQTQIFAPADGQVTYVISTKVGETVNAFQTIAQISDISRMNIRTSAENAVALPLGAEVILIYDKSEFAGTVVANPQTLATDPDASIRKSALIRLNGELPAAAQLGSSVQIRFLKEKRENVLILSRSNINVMSGRHFVNVLEDGIRVEKDIEIGLMTDTEAEIVSGISDDDLIITN